VAPASSDPPRGGEPGAAAPGTPLTPEAHEAKVTLPAGVDLHARPAGLLVKTALRYQARITVSSGDRAADARSLLGLLGLSARGGSTLHLRGEGEDAGAAVEALTQTIARLGSQD
jgi:phosphotransferase system HPr (HPr) family protein